MKYICRQLGAMLIYIGVKLVTRDEDACFYISSGVVSPPPEPAKPDPQFSNYQTDGGI